MNRNPGTDTHHSSFRIHHCIAGSRKARGVAVIIDVFRASSTIVAAFGAGAERVIPVGELDAAYELKRRNPGFLLFGERGCLPPAGFDGGNSPAAMAKLHLRGKTVILTTSAGTQGIVNATHADEIVIGCFLNARAAADRIAKARPSEVSLVAMGVAGVKPALEDELCAQYIRALCTGEDIDLDDIRARIMKDPEALKFLDRSDPVYSPDDVEFCLRANAYSIVPVFDGHSLKVLKQDGQDQAG